MGEMGELPFDVMKDPCVGHFVNYLSSERNASPHTMSAYVLDLGQFARMTWGDEAKPPFKWGGVDRFGSRKFLVSFQKGNRKATTTGRKLASLRSFYKFLEREEYVETNPFGGLRAPKRPRSLPEVLSVNQMVSLLDAPAIRFNRSRPSDGSVPDPVSEYAALRDSAILETLYSTGARVSELTGLTMPDVDLLSGVIMVRGKGKKERLCPLGAPACKALRAMMQKGAELWSDSAVKIHPVKINAHDLVCKYLNQLGICRPTKFCLKFPLFEVKSMGLPLRGNIGPESVAPKEEK